MNGLGTNIDAEIKAVNALTPLTVTAGGTTTNDTVQQTGITIDTAALGRRFNSVSFRAVGRASMAATKTAAISILAEDAASSSGPFATIGAAAGAAPSDQNIGSTAAGSAQTVDFDHHMNVDLRAARRYVRAKVTVDMGSGSTYGDTTVIGAVAVFGGADSIPSS